MVNTFDYLTVLWGWSPGSSRCARAPGMWAPLAYPVPPTLKKTIKTINNYGWYSGPCLGATVGQVWNS